jgi:hypothetical protein
MTGHRRLAVGFATAALVASVGAGTTASAATTAAATPHASYSSYVSLGDSYTAGPLIGDQTGGLCFRSTENYPSLVASALGIANFTDVSCSGATTDNMTQSQSDDGVTINGPQFNALTSSTQLVTLGIGGNDIGFTSIFETCAEDSIDNPWGDPCEQHYTSGGTDQLAAAVQATAPKVAAVLAEIRQLSPQATVLVVGYPDLLPQGSTGCWPVVPIADGDVVYLRGVEQELNSMLRQQAQAAGDIYVDTYTSSIGHDMCQSGSNAWINGVIPTNGGFSVHPDEQGMINDENDVLAALGD